MIIYNGKHLIGGSPKSARRSIIAWGEENNFIKLGDNDVKKLENFQPVFIVRNPQDRLEKQIHTYVKRFAEAQSHTLAQQWPDSKELLEETLADDPKDWFNIDPIHFVKQTSYSDKYKNVPWLYISLDDLGDWSELNGYTRFELFPETSDPWLHNEIKDWLSVTPVHEQYQEDFDLFQKT